MYSIRNILIILLFYSTTAMAEPASESSIRQLLEINQAQKLVDGMQAQFNSLMNNSVQQALKGQTPTPEQQQSIENMKNKMITLLHGELAWEKLEPLYIRLYQETFSEEEVLGIQSFYKTAAGQAVLKKMPVLMQKTMLDMQKIIAGITPQMKQIQENFAAEMAAPGK
jgi:hypothetical protein